MLPNTTDWYGRFRIGNNPRNDHLIDRRCSARQNYTGIQGIPVQDQAVTESMGPSSTAPRSISAPATA